MNESTGLLIFMYITKRMHWMSFKRRHIKLIIIHSLKHPDYFMTWLTRIIIRCAGHILKRRNNIVPLTDEVLSDLSVIYHSGHDEAIDLLNAIGQLKGNYRSAIILFYYYDYSIKTISEIMEIPEGTVKTYLSRGKAELKKSYKDEEGKCNG